MHRNSYNYHQLSMNWWLRRILIAMKRVSSSKKWRTCTLPWCPLNCQCLLLNDTAAIIQYGWVSTSSVSPMSSNVRKTMILVLSGQQTTHLCSALYSNPKVCKPTFRISSFFDTPHHPNSSTSHWLSYRFWPDSKIWHHVNGDLPQHH